MNKPFSGQFAVISQPNVPLRSQWTPAVAQCNTGAINNGNTNLSVNPKNLNINSHRYQVVVPLNVDYPITTHQLKTLMHISSNVLQLILTKNYLGVNFNHNAINVRKTCLYQLDRYLSNRSDIVIRHDAVNNSISRHRENVTALIPNQLNKILLENKHIIHAIAYCKRLVTKDIYIKLKESGIQNISIVTFPISRRKQNLTEFWRKHSQ